MHFTDVTSHDLKHLEASDRRSC